MSLRSSMLALAKIRETLFWQERCAQQMLWMVDLVGDAKKASRLDP